MATINKKRRLGREVSIVGAGMSDFGAFKEKDSRDLFTEAFQEMMGHLDQGIDIEDIECGYLGNYSSDLFEHQGHTAPIMADWLGMENRLKRNCKKLVGGCRRQRLVLKMMEKMKKHM